MALSPKSKKQLQTLAHRLRPVVAVGINGLTDAVNNEINRALDDHELIKLKITTEDRILKKAIFAEICKVNKAQPVQLIGGVGVIFRKNPEKE